MTGPFPIGEALARALDRSAKIAKLPAFVIAKVWMPAVEREDHVDPVRLRGGPSAPDAFAKWRHALAISRGEWPMNMTARVLVRFAGEVSAFDARWICVRGSASQNLVRVHCCKLCGCTEDRACPQGCAWATHDVCTACMENPR